MGLAIKGWTVHEEAPQPRCQGQSVQVAFRILVQALQVAGLTFSKAAQLNPKLRGGLVRCQVDFVLKTSAFILTSLSVG